MKLIYRKIFFFTLAVTLIIGGYTCWKSYLYPLCGQQPPDTNVLSNKALTISQDTRFLVQQTLTKREYHISYDSLTHIMQSPNRHQGIRAYYEPGRLRIVDRKTTNISEPILQLTNEGIYADGRLALAPKQSVNIELRENKLQIHHPGFTEEYINNQNGVRQNFIVKSAPKGTRTLQVRLAADGVQITDRGTNYLSFSHRSRNFIDTLHYRDLHCWDANGKPLPSNLACVNSKIQLEVNVENAVYPVTIDPLIVNGNPENADQTLNGDQGQSGWGASVSGAGDVNNDGFDDVIVGAPFYDLLQPNEGAAFVFYGTSTGIDIQSPSVLKVGQKDANFAASVASAGDVNHDGFNDIAVGAPYFDNEEEDEGAAFVFLGGTDGISPTAQARLEGNTAYANMGSSVANAGDVNGDQYGDLIVGAIGWQNTEAGEGAAFVFHGSLQGIEQTIKATLEGNMNYAMTSSVSSAGDVDNDGFSDVIVGSMGYSNGETFEGAATVYYGSANGITINNSIILEGNQQFSAMGVSVAGPGDLNGDGFDDVAVGASEFSNGETGEGVIFVFYGSPTGLTPQSFVLLEKDQANADFGHSISGLGDLNGDGYNDIVVGAYHFDNDQNDEGAAFIFLGSPQGPKPTSLIYESNQTGSQMGISVGNAGDVNGDGITDIIFGAQTYGSNAQGAAFIFRWDVSLPVQLVRFFGKALDNVIELSWSTSSEANSDRFEIQKADNRRQWKSIGQVAASENTNAVSEYHFFDQNPLSHENLYRLKMIDKDRTYTYSSISSVNFKIPDSRWLIVYPSPSSKTIRFQSVSPTAITIFSSAGRQVLQANSLRTNEDIDISTVSPGIYTILAEFRDGKTSTCKLVVQ